MGIFRDNLLKRHPLLVHDDDMLNLTGGAM